jgi:hypothetical protein
VCVPGATDTRRAPRRPGRSGPAGAFIIPAASAYRLQRQSGLERRDGHRAGAIGHLRLTCFPLEGLFDLVIVGGGR